MNVHFKSLFSVAFPYNTLKFQFATLFDKLNHSENFNSHNLSSGVSNSHQQAESKCNFLKLADLY